MLSLLSTLEEGSEDDEDDDKVSRHHKSLLIFPAMESFQACKLAAMLGKVTFIQFQHKQALKLAVMVGDTLSTHVHVFSDFLMRNEEFGGLFCTPRNFILLELKSCLLYDKALVQVAVEALQKQEDKFLEEYILMDNFWKRNGAFMPFKSCKTFKVCFDIPLVDSRLFKAFVLISKDGDDFGVGFTLCCSLFLKHDEHLWKRDRALVPSKLCKSFKVCFALLLPCHSRAFSLHLAGEGLNGLQSFGNNLLVHSCFFKVCLKLLTTLIFDSWLFDVSLVLSEAPGSESIQLTAHAQEANSFARSYVWFKHFLQCGVHPPWFPPKRSSLVVMNDDGRVSSLPFLLVHVGRGTTHMKLIGHVYYPEVLAFMTKGPLVRVEWAVFGNQGTLHVLQCSAEVDLEMKSDFCPFHLLVNHLLMGNTHGIKDPVDIYAQVLCWTDKQVKGAFSFPLFSFSAVFKEGRLHVTPYFIFKIVDEAPYGPSLDKSQFSVTCQTLLWMDCTVMSSMVFSWTWICMACSMQGYGFMDAKGFAHVSHMHFVHDGKLCFLYVMYFKGLCSLVLIIQNPHPNVAPPFFTFVLYFILSFNGN